MGGFAAVQISPAQRSHPGTEWWARYQPKDYTVIEGLGSLHELRELCALAHELGIMVVADIVFNHMLVVAGSREWERAQRDTQLLKVLKQKLTDAVGPTLDAEDFQWPWFKMVGPHWDNENRYEGWGNGEWSELRYCPKVVGVHKQHLQTLLDAGVRGFRFDAVKHMRPEQLDEYSRFLHASTPGVYVYGEVLSPDARMHSEYMEPPLRMPTTDFGLTISLNKLIREGAGQVDASVDAGVAPDSSKTHIHADFRTTPAAVSADSVRFARNHDTVMNPGLYYGLDASCASARVVWIWMLAVHDGTVLLYPDDVFHNDSAALLRRAVRFRERLANCAAASEVCLRYGKAGPPRVLAILLRGLGDELVGVCLVNLAHDANLRVTSVPLPERLTCSPQDQAEVTLTKEDSATIILEPDGSLWDTEGAPQTLLIAPHDAAFLLVVP